jgi:signal transduction histidine kinase
VRRTLLWWLIWLSTVGYLVASVVALAATAFDASVWVWLVFGPPVFFVAGVYLFVNRPGHPIGELAVVVALTSLVIPQIIEVPVVVRFWESGLQDWMWAPLWAVQTLTAVGVVAGSALIALLPDGRIRHRRERRFIIAAALTIITPTLALVSNPTIRRYEEMSFPGITEVPSPLVIDGLDSLGPLFEVLTALPFAVFLGSVVMLILRQRDASRRERRQVRWVLWAGVIAMLAGVAPMVLSALGLTDPLTHGLTGFFFFIPTIVLPLSIVAAVMEPSWIDVDFVIRKSVVYGSLSVLILLAYVAAAAALGMAAGSRLPIEIAVLVTVVIAVLFQPARTWLQSRADRWVFGERPTPYEVMTDFGASLEATIQPEELPARLVDAVRRATGASWVSVVFNGGDSARVGVPADDASLTLPIRPSGTEIGHIELGPGTRGSYDKEDVDLVQTLAGQAGLAVANARLAARIVTAAESERRRIERNIHDGAQQELVALVARLGMARFEAGHGDISPEQLAALQEEANRILSDLRELAQGIHPSILTDAGLLEAVEERCSRLPIEVSLQASPELRWERFDDDVEGAAYFFITEAITNVMKHSQATAAEVSLRREGQRLTLEVSDHGCGFDVEETEHHGLAGLRDRITALGGAVRVLSRPESGTVLTATLPVP